MSSLKKSQERSNRPIPVLGFSVFHIDVPQLPSSSLNPNNRAHYRKKGQAKQLLTEVVTEATQIACGSLGKRGWRAAEFPWSKVSIQVVWRYFYGVRPDADNCLAMLKAAFDALVCSGVLEDDRHVIHLPMELVKASSKDDAGFLMTIRKVDGTACPLCMRLNDPQKGK